MIVGILLATAQEDEYENINNLIFQGKFSAFRVTGIRIRDGNAAQNGLVNYPCEKKTRLSKALEQSGVPVPIKFWDV